MVYRVAVTITRLPGMAANSFNGRAVTSKAEYYIRCKTAEIPSCHFNPGRPSFGSGISPYPFPRCLYRIFA